MPLHHANRLLDAAGGIILGTEGIKQAFATGRGKVMVRAQTSIEEIRGGRFAIIVTEIPYQVQKGRLIERIAEIINAKKLPILEDVRDESADDVRIVMISDSCHSGTVSRAARTVQAAAVDGAPLVRTRLLPLALAMKTFRNHRDFYTALGRQHRGPDERVLTRELDMPLRCPVLLVAGCQDNQESQDGVGNGRFTQELLRVWDEGRFDADWTTLASRIVANMPPSQTPRLTLIGRSPEALAAELPFSI